MKNSSEEKSVYRLEDLFTSAFLLVAVLVLSVLGGIEKIYLGFVVFNPVLYFLLGVLFYKTERVYVISQAIGGTYMAVKGRYAQMIGQLTMLSAVLSLIVLNFINLYASAYYMFTIYLQIFLVSAIFIFISYKYGEHMFSR